MTWNPGDPCPGCGQRPCVCVTISLPQENIPGYWVDDEDGYPRFIPGVAVTHSRTKYINPDTGDNDSPDYCDECSAAAQDWVRWPCPASEKEGTA